MDSLSEAIMNIKKVYDENDITIPFPIRILDFGIKENERLSDVLLNDHNKKASKS